MKLAYSILLPDSKGTMFAYRGETKEVMENLKNIGYDGVELFVRNPAELDIGGLVKLIEKTELEVCAIGTAPIGIEDKLLLLDSSYEVRTAAITRAKEVVDFAAIFGAAVNIGKFRGNLPGNNRAEGWKWLQQGMTEICEYAAKKDIVIALEPQSRTNLNNINTTQEGMQWIDNMDISNLFLMLDTYHMDLEEKSLTASLLEAGSRIRHVHIADSSRSIPGQGSINFMEILRVLKNLNYEGYLSLEIAQSPDGLTAATKSWKYLNYICRELI